MRVVGELDCNCPCDLIKLQVAEKRASALVMDGMRMQICRAGPSGMYLLFDFYWSKPAHADA